MRVGASKQEAREEAKKERSKEAKKQTSNGALARKPYSVSASAGMSETRESRCAAVVLYYGSILRSIRSISRLKWSPFLPSSDLLPCLEILHNTVHRMKLECPSLISSKLS